MASLRTMNISRREITRELTLRSQGANNSQMEKQEWGEAQGETTMGEDSMEDQEEDIMEVVETEADIKAKGEADMWVIDIMVTEMVEHQKALVIKAVIREVVQEAGEATMEQLDGIRMVDTMLLTLKHKINQ